MKNFEFLEHTADSKFRAHGKTLEEAFENSALATMETMIDASTIDSKVTEKIKIKASDLEELLYKWLSEIIYLFSSKNIVFSSFEVEIKKNKTYELNGEATGEKINLSKHSFETEVKAITYHDLEITKNKKYEITALLDT